MSGGPDGNVSLRHFVFDAHERSRCPRHARPCLYRRLARADRHGHAIRPPHHAWHPLKHRHAQRIALAASLLRYAVDYGPLARPVPICHALSTERSHDFLRRRLSPRGPVRRPPPLPQPRPVAGLSVCGRTFTSTLMNLRVPPSLLGLLQKGFAQSNTNPRLDVVAGYGAACVVPQLCSTAAFTSGSNCAPRHPCAEHTCHASKPSAPRKSAPSRLAPSSLASRSTAPGNAAPRMSV